MITIFKVGHADSSNGRRARPPLTDGRMKNASYHLWTFAFDFRKMI